jgi:hypothetical protein
LSRQDPVQNSAQEPAETTGQGEDPGEHGGAAGHEGHDPEHGHVHGHGQSSSRGVDSSHPGPGHPDQGHPGGHPGPAHPSNHGAETTHAAPVPGHGKSAHAAGIAHPAPGPGSTSSRDKAAGKATDAASGTAAGAASGTESEKSAGTAAAPASGKAAGTAAVAPPAPRTEPLPAAAGSRAGSGSGSGTGSGSGGSAKAAGRVRGAASAERHDAKYVAAALPWYGLDAGWQGPRALGTLSTGPDGLVEFGTLRHGDPGATRPDARTQRRAVTVLTMARLGRRPLYKADGTSAGSVEAMTVNAAAALAGVGLVEDNWPWELGASVRQHWLDQQRELAYVLSESLGTDPWQELTVPVGEQQLAFHYRESTYGWVMAGARADCFIAAYGRGVSAYSLAFVRVDPAFYS